MWSYDFIADRTYNWKTLRTLCVIDEFRRESIAVRMARRLKSTYVNEAPDLLCCAAAPAHIRPDSGPARIALALRELIAAAGAKTAYTELGNPVAGSRETCSIIEYILGIIKCQGACERSYKVPHLPLPPSSLNARHASILIVLFFFAIGFTAAKWAQVLDFIPQSTDTMMALEQTLRSSSVLQSLTKFALQAGMDPVLLSRIIGGFTFAFLFSSLYIFALSLLR